MGFKIVSMPEGAQPAAAPNEASADTLTNDAATPSDGPRFKVLGVYRGDGARSAPTAYQVGEAAEWDKYRDEKANRSGVTGVLADFNEYLGGRPEATFSPEYRKIDNKAVSALTGFGEYFGRGAGDELRAAAVGALTDRSYDETLDITRRQDTENGEANPLSYLGGMGAGVIADIGLLRGIPTAPGLKGLGQTTAIGGGVGAFTGFMSGEGGFENRLEGAQTEGLIGAALGPAVKAGELLIGGGKRAINATRDALQPAEVKAARRAEREFIDAAIADRVAAAKAGTYFKDDRRFMDEFDMERARELNQSPSAADLGGDRLRGTIKNAVRGDESAAGDFEAAARARQSGASDRITETVTEMLSPGSVSRGGINASDDLEAIRQYARVRNAQNYKEAFNHPGAQNVFDDDLRRLTGSTAVQDAIRQAVREQAEDRIAKNLPNDGPVFEMGADGLLNLKGGKASLEVWDRATKLLRDAAENARGPTGKATNTTERLLRLREEIVKRLDNATRMPGEDFSAYRRARSTAAEFFGASDAFEAGVKSFGKTDVMDSSMTRSWLEQMSPDERLLFGRGYTSGLVEKLSSTPDAAEVDKLLNNAAARSKLRMALGEEQAADVEMYLRREGLMRATSKAAQEAARSARDSSMIRQMGDAGGDLAGGAIAGTILAGGNPLSLETFLGAAAMRGGRKILERMTDKKRRLFANAMSELATTQSRERIAALFKQIDNDPQLAALTGRAVSYGYANTGRPIAADAFGIGVVGAGTAALGEGSEQAAGQLTAPSAEPAYARGGRVSAEQPYDALMHLRSLEGADSRTAALLEARAIANGSSPEDELLRLAKARGILKDGDARVGYAEGGLARRLESASDLYQPQMSSDLPTYDASAAEENRLKRYLSQLSEQQRMNIAIRLTPMSLQELMAADAYQRPKLSKEGVRLAPRNGVARLADGGLVSDAVRDQGVSPAGRAYLTGSGNTGDQPADTAYDHRGGTPARSPKRVNAGRRNSVTMGSRDRQRPERMRIAPAPMTDALKREFWNSLREQMVSRGWNADDVDFPVFDPEPNTAAVMMEPVAMVESVEIAVEPKKALPKAPLDKDIAKAAEKRRAKRLAQGEPPEILP